MRVIPETPMIISASNERNGRDRERVIQVYCLGEIIIAEDESTDGNRDVLDQLQEQYHES